jgi:hypothetical protein
VVEVMSNVVAPFRPVDAEVIAKPATPARPRVSWFPGFENVLLYGALGVRRAVRASMALNMVGNKVFVQEVFCLTKVTLEFLWTFLVCFLVTLPVSLFAESFFASGTEVFRHGG